MTVWDFGSRLDALAADHRLRVRRTVSSPQRPHLTVDGRELLSFASNDYLGLAAHPEIVQAAQAGAERFGVGSGAAHFLSGHSTAHAQLEAALCEYSQCESALLFSTGYLANLALLTALADRETLICADKLNHACLNDGARLSRAEFRRYAHGDIAHLRSLLDASDAKRKLIATDAVFSMDGDVAPLAEMLALAERHDALLVVDDAHGFGVLGPEGRGTLAELGLRSPRIVVMATLGKAVGTAGAFVAARRDIADWIMQTAPCYLFTTAAPPMIAQATLKALDLVREGDALRRALRENIAHFRQGAAPVATARGWWLGHGVTAIQPLVIGDNATALRVSDALLRRGIWAPVIRPPTVPAGTARLRVSLSAAHTFDDIDRLLAALREVPA
ncbi:MAG: 8-amino-7-oxononanoate synthase [Betaproteobacteria bacterium]|nr:8-amino-7-oxononanoate synthase [Betaproteobacteria bacterium]